VCVDLWPLPGVLGRVAGQVPRGGHAAGHGPQQRGDPLEGHPGHDLAPAAAPAPPAQGKVAQPRRAHHALGRQRPEHGESHRPAGVGQEGPELHAQHLPRVPAGLVQHPPPARVATLGRQPRGGPGEDHCEPPHPQHHPGPGRRQPDPRQHPLRFQYRAVPGGWCAPVFQGHRHLQPQPAGLPGEVGAGECEGGRSYSSMT